MPAAALLAALALQAATPETLADLERAFDQTCNNRVYGQFDDMCSAMEGQVKRYRAELKRHPRAGGPVPAIPRAAASPTPPVAASVPPPVADEPPAAAAPKGEEEQPRASPAPSPTPTGEDSMPDQASTPNPLPPTDAATDAPSPTGAGSSDSLAQAFEAVRGARPTDDDTPEIAADDVGATSLAEEMGAGSQKP